MTEIVIYTKPTCPYCHAAKALLQRKGQAFFEIDIMAEPQRRAEMIARAGGRTTVPQIFIDGQHVGGCDDLHALEEAGKLDILFSSAEKAS